MKMAASGRDVVARDPFREAVWEEVGVCQRLRDVM